MKLGVDARMMHGAWRYRGIGRYTASILAPLQKEDLIAFLPEGQEVENYRFIAKGNSFFPYWEQIVLPKIVKNNSLDYLLCPSITAPISKLGNCKKIIVIYDLIFMQPFSDLPASHSLYNNFGRLYRRFTAPKSYGSADLLISISEYSRTELHEMFGIDKNKVHVIPCSIKNDWFIDHPVDASDRGQYLLTVSGDAPSKNLPNILQAFAFANKSKGNKFKLKVVGVAIKSQSFLIKKAEELGIKDYVIFEKFVSNEDLQELYRNAWASLTLSLYEGFGIPIVEAMASGTPVVCSNTTSMPEVAGNVGIYADPRDIENMASAISKIMCANVNERNKIAREGMKRALMFSESVVAGQIESFWKKIK